MDETEIFRPTFKKCNLFGIYFTPPKMPLIFSRYSDGVML